MPTSGVGPPAAPRLWLGLVLLVAVVARSFRLSWGLPDFVLPDGFDYFIQPGARMARGELIPESFLHPPLLVYVLAIGDLVWSLATGEAIPSLLRQSPAAVQDLTLLGRVVCVAFAVGSVAVLYALARRLVGTRAALLAAAAFAVSPLHVLESHRVNPDGPMIFFALCAAHQALVAAERRSTPRLYAAFALAGAAAATKYTGLAAVSVPLWIALTWPAASTARRLRSCVVGGLATTVVIALVLLPAAFDVASLRQALEAQVVTGYRQGTELPARDWWLATYGRFPIVIGPYSVGWSVYLLALAGLGVLAARNRRALAVTAAACLPFLVVQGGAAFGYPRWYLPIVPWLCLSAGAAVDRLWDRSSRTGAGVALVALAYTAALTGSQCLRLGLEPQRALVAWLTDQAARRGESAAPLTVTYPSPLLQRYDPLGPMLERAPVKIVYTLGWSSPDRRGGASDGDPGARATRARQRQWIDEHDVDFLIVPSFVEAIIPQRGGQHELYGAIVDGSLGTSPTAEFRSRFFTESLYVWADPGLTMHWATGINGYKVFAPAESPPGERRS